MRTLPPMVRRSSRACRDRVVQVDGARLQPLATGEGQHLGGELRAALGRLRHHL